MQFYHLYHPRYRDDKEWAESKACDYDVANYLELPAVICPDCGATWSWRGLRLIIDIPPDSPMRQMLQQGRPVPYVEYERIVENLRQAFQLPQSTVLVPGMRVGPLSVSIRNITGLHDFNWCTSGEVVITQKAAGVLTSAGLTGYNLHPVQVTGSNSAFQSDLSLFELVVTGKGGPMAAGAGLELVHVCTKCGRREYKAVYEGMSGSYRFQGLYADLSTWDGSDFFLFEDWPTIIMITETARNALLAGDLTNYELYAAPAGGFRW